MDTYYAHIIRELIAQEYIVVAADYRGSTGYGAGTYNNIDYGGLENEDVYISRNYMVDNFDIVDGSRVGIMGWSHGGMITLMNLFNYPGQYKCGFAGVPVSDVIMRMGYASDSYRKIFSAKNHIGQTAKDNIAEYKIFERAPGAHSFDRLDTYESSKIRLDIYKFMGRYLKPNKPFGSVKELRKAAYKF